MNKHLPPEIRCIILLIVRGVSPMDWTTRVMPCLIFGTEWHDDVAHWLKKGTSKLRKVALVNKNLYQLATPLLYEIVPLWWDTQDDELDDRSKLTLRTLLENPSLCSYAHVLAISGMSAVNSGVLAPLVSSFTRLSWTILRSSDVAEIDRAAIWSSPNLVLDDCTLGNEASAFTRRAPTEFRNLTVMSAPQVSPPFNFPALIGPSTRILTITQGFLQFIQPAELFRNLTHLEIVLEPAYNRSYKLGPGFLSAEPPLRLEHLRLTSQDADWPDELVVNPGTLPNLRSLAVVRSQLAQHFNGHVNITELEIETEDADSTNWELSGVDLPSVQTLRVAVPETEEPLNAVVDAYKYPERLKNVLMKNLYLDADISEDFKHAVIKLPKIHCLVYNILEDDDIIGLFEDSTGSREALQAARAACPQLELVAWGRIRAWVFSADSGWTLAVDGDCGWWGWEWLGPFELEQM